MNGNGTLTAALRVPVSPEFKRRLKALALKQRRSLASAVRVLLEEAMELEESLAPPDSERLEYELELSIAEAARLLRKGYDIRVWEPKYTQETLL